MSLTFIVFYLSLIFLNGSFLFAQISEIVISEGSCIGENITPNEARRRALASARSEAIKKVVGIDIVEETFRKISEVNESNKKQVYDSFFRLTNTKSSGRIIREQIIEWHTELLQNIPIYNVKIRAKVMIEKSTSDPSFTTDIKLSRDVLYSGKDDLEFNIWASQDCYIVLFNLMANDSVQIIFPNKYIKNTIYSTKLKKQIFEDEIENLGITFPVVLREGVSSDYEALYLVAIKDKQYMKSLPFITNEKYESVGLKRALTDIQSWLITIPRNKRSEVIKSFEIRKSG